MNRSESVLEETLALAERKLRESSTLNRAVRTTLVTIGLAVAIMLPLASPEFNTPPPDTNRPPDIHPSIQFSPMLNVPPATVKVVKVGSDTRIEKTSIINLPPVEVRIAGAPPVNRNWYRTVLGGGDEFWALPDASFVLAAEQVKGCSEKDGGCEASLSFKSGGMAPISGAFTLSHRDIALAKDLDKPGVCTVHDPKLDRLLTRTARCEFTRGSGLLDSAIQDYDLCVWLRRSEVLEAQTEEKADNVALDIRWRKINLQPDTNEHCEDYL